MPCVCVCVGGGGGGVEWERGEGWGARSVVHHGHITTVALNK